MLHRKKIHVGVIGMYGSGKTVLLTSLINHLVSHHPDRLPIGHGKVELGCLKRDLPVDAGFTKFDYGYYRSCLGTQVWPDKTLASAQYHCRLLVKRTEKQCDQIELTLTDMAGERFAHLSMAGQTYEQWSDSILEPFSNLEYQAPAAEFLGLLEQPGSRPMRSSRPIAACWHRLIYSYLPLVSPSTFLVDANSRHCEALNVST